MRRTALTALAACLIGSGAAAHTPYLTPNVFDPFNGGLVTLDAAFAERFFIPEVVFDDSDFEVHTPQGRIVSPDKVASLRTRVVLEHELADEGTYRFSTGRRWGRVNLVYERDGRNGLATRQADLPEDAVLTDHYQSYTMAETYVTRGAPDNAVLAPRKDGLEFAAQSHPNDLFAGESLRMQALFYGKPLVGLEIDVFLAGRGSHDDSPVVTLTSDADGAFAFTPETGGVYLMRARHRADAPPEGAEAPEVSHTYTLVFEAVE